MRHVVSLLIVAALTVVYASTPAHADWDPGDGNKMHFPQLPDFDGFDVNFQTPKVLADDWRCSQSGAVTDIHFWFSAKGDWLDIQGDLTQQIFNIHVSIHDDVPDPDGPGPAYSHPGALLWEKDYLVTEVQIREFGQGPQEWFDPNTGEWLGDDHFMIYQCNIDSIADPFFQEQGRIYWLDISIESAGDLGWKTADLDRYPDPYTGVHFTDDAVWTDDPATGGWYELTDTSGVSIDLAFVITGEPVPWEHKMHFPQLPDVDGVDVNFQTPKTLADDWRCSETGPVEDIHFWFSARSDWFEIGAPWEQQIQNIHVSIHSNIPDPDGPGPLYSMPGELLWARDYAATEVNISEFFTPGQDWYNPNTGAYIVDDHNKLYRVDIEGIESPFYQMQDSVYWLDVTIASNGLLGWKTSDRDRYPPPYTGSHYEDDAVWTDEPAAGQWNELIYPWGPYEGQSMDMAFVITGKSIEWKHKMHFPQLPDVDGADVNFRTPKVLADDWKCSQSGRVTDIHFWFSARGDWLDIHGDLSRQIDNIHLSIHSNIPDPDGQGPFYSMPGEPLWERNLKVDSTVTILEFVTPGQDWYDPNTGEYIFQDHNRMYRCDILLAPYPSYFFQRQDSIYWLDISIESADFLGWKTADVFRYPDPYTGMHYEDDAVWADLPLENWQELVYPPGTPQGGRSIDLAFVITGDSTLVGVGDEAGGSPQSYKLMQNYPNPFNPTTIIRYEIPSQSSVHLAVYNVAGQLVRVLESGTRPIGRYEATWDARDSAGRTVASGIYFYRLKAGSFLQTRKMVLLK